MLPNRRRLQDYVEKGNPEQIREIGQCCGRGIKLRGCVEVWEEEMKLGASSGAVLVVLVPQHRRSAWPAARRGMLPLCYARCRAARKGYSSGAEDARPVRPATPEQHC